MNNYQFRIEDDMMLWGTSVIICFILFSGCASAEGIKRILGGNTVTIGQYPYQASLRVMGNHYCGGAIVSEKHILTAAHCFNNFTVPPFQYFRVITGTSYRKKTARGTGGNSHRISKFDVHPDWIPFDEETDGKSYPNDLAVITLTDKIVFDEYQQKIDLPSHDFKEGLPANLTGWGLTSQNPDIRPKQLQMIETKLVSQEECQYRITEPETIIYDTHVCAFRSRGRGPCSGDSGGPLAADGKLVGIVSWVDGVTCAAGIPEVYTNVYQFKDYIEDIMKNSS